MQRQSKRTSSLKASLAIKENSIANKPKAKKMTGVENKPTLVTARAKRHTSPPSNEEPNAKRNPLGNITNAAITALELPRGKDAKNGGKESDVDVVSLAPRRSQRLLQRGERSSSKSPSESSLSCDMTTEATPITSVQNFLQATTLSDDSLRSDECLIEEERPIEVPLWKDIDAAEAGDPLFNSEYAPDIYRYMKEREEYFHVEGYLEYQPDVNSNMRTILIDWLIEVQENFELFHETLYLAVKIVDRFLSKKQVKREYLQLVGATAMLIAAKFEELSPPLVEDFIYLCDDAYTHSELLKMETEILHTLGYDINMPVAYRFLRRLARAAEASMETHTLARFISESTLQEYKFISDKPSLIAASSMYLALRMKKLGPWTPTLQHYSGYSVSQLLPMVHRLNTLIATPMTTTCTVQSKYSHEVFFKVALTSPLSDVNEDARHGLVELKELEEKARQEQGIQEST